MPTTQARKDNAAASRPAPGAAPQARRGARAKIGPEAALGTAVRNPGMLGADEVVAMQAAAGNRAVVGLLQAKQVRSKVDDRTRVHEAAKVGIGETSGPLPYLEQIQRSFGRHDVTGVAAHTGAQATGGARAMGAAAFTMGNHVAFAGQADLRTAAHEAAHVVQQRAGVQLAGGVGEKEDRYERHADAVAEEVVQGRSAEGLLDRGSGMRQAPTRSPAPAVQRKLVYEQETFKNTPKENNLAEALVEVIGKQVPQWKALADDKNITMFIGIDDSSSPNPAEVTNPVKDPARKGHWVFVLRIRRWFIQSHSLGYVIGILNHEIGVHVVPYLAKIQENIAAELGDKALPHAEEDLTAKEKGGIDDHRRAMEAGTAQFKAYLDLAVNSANALSKAGKQSAAEDVLFAYLMDLAAMTPTGDKGAVVKKALIPGPWQQRTYAYVLARYNGLVQHLPEDWQKAMPKMTTKDVEKTFLDFRSQIPKKKATFIAIAILILICLVIWIVKMFR